MSYDEDSTWARTGSEANPPWFSSHPGKNALELSRLLVDCWVWFTAGPGFNPKAEAARARKAGRFRAQFLQLTGSMYFCYSVSDFAYFPNALSVYCPVPLYSRSG